MAQGRHPECLGNSVAAADQVPWGYAEKDPGACPFGGLEGGSFPQSSLKMKLHLEPQAKNSGIKRVYDGGSGVAGSIGWHFRSHPKILFLLSFPILGFLFPSGCTSNSLEPRFFSPSVREQDPLRFSQDRPLSPCPMHWLPSEVPREQYLMHTYWVDLQMLSESENRSVCPALCDPVDYIVHGIL